MIWEEETSQVNKNFTHCKVFLAFIYCMSASFHYIPIPSSDKVLSTVFQVVISKANFCSLLYKTASFPHKLSLRKVKLPCLRHLVYTMPVSTAILFLPQWCLLLFQFQKEHPLSAGEQAFHMCVNLCEPNPQSPKLDPFLISIFLFPLPAPLFPWLLCFPLPFISFKTCYCDERKK